MPGIVLKIPAGVSEVVEGHHGFDGMIVEEVDNPLVMVDDISVPIALLRLDPAPLQGETVGVYSYRFEQMEVLPAQLIMMGDLGF
jgi:hypothetical protein